MIKVGDALGEGREEGEMMADEKVETKVGAVYGKVEVTGGLTPLGGRRRRMRRGDGCKCIRVRSGDGGRKK